MEQEKYQRMQQMFQDNVLVRRKTFKRRIKWFVKPVQTLKETKDRTRNSLERRFQKILLDSPKNYNC